MVITDPTFQIKTEEVSSKYGRFVIDPLPVGFGHTLGASLRRTLLSSMSGAAITSVVINGVSHQFQTLEGMKEDVVDLILNLKQVRVQLHEGETATLSLDVSGPMEVTAGEIQTPANVEIANPDLYLATLADKKSSLKVEIVVSKGMGYSAAEERKSETVGVIPLDALYNPVSRVNYQVAATRVGRETNLDKLILELWTDGTLDPLDALRQAAKILVGYFLQIFEPKATADEANVAVTPSVSDEVLKMLIEELDLPTRLENALKNGGIETVGQLLGTQRKELMKIKNLGGKSLEVIEEKLREKGVALSI